MLNKSRLWALALLVATFAAGAAVGGVVSAALGRPSEGMARERRPSYAERLQGELALTPAQRESVEVILDRRQAAMSELWRTVSPRFDSLRVQIRGEILSVLSPEQQTQFQALTARSDSARAAREREYGGRRGR